MRRLRSTNSLTHEVGARPRTARLYARILRAYGSNATTLIALAAILFLPLAALDLLANAVQPDLDSFTGVELGALIAAVVVRSAAGLLGTVFYSGAVSSIVLDPGVTWKHVRDLVPTLPYRRLIAVDVVFWLGVVIGLVLLIIPALVFFVYFALAAPAVELEGRSVRDGLRRSRELVRGSFWTVFGIVIPIVAATAAATSLAIEASAALIHDSVLGNWLGATIGNVVLTPLFAVAVVVLTVELVEARGERIPPTSTPPQ